jgi:uncharacterized lipoprotein YddW (UPF0748 family)
VRGAGTTYFLSSKEPWAWELTGRDPSATGRDPGWDPLRKAVTDAHKNGLQLHAYINTLPGWEHEKNPPPGARALWTTHRSWFMVDKQGRTMSPNPFYSFLNPALPQVRDHLTALVRDMVQRYNVDGVHLDYIRWPGEKGNFSYDDVTRSVYRADTANLKLDETRKWNRWRADQIRILLRSIYSNVKQVRPNCVVSAAVFADPDAAENSHCQWSWTWRQGLECDLIFPMNYSNRETVFRQRMKFFTRKAQGIHLGMGIRTSHDFSVLQRQVRQARQAGIKHIALFAYDDFHRNHYLNAKGQLVRRLWQ